MTNTETLKQRPKDFTSTDLSGHDFSYQDLRGATFKGANLKGANFCQANLIGANFSGANLKKANFDNADLLRATLKSAKLEYANLTGANLSQARCDGARFIRADLTGANLSRAVLIEANLSEATIKHARLVYAKLQRSLLSVTLFQESDLTKADFTDAKFSRTNFANAVLTGATVAEVELHNNCYLKGATLPHERASHRQSAAAQPQSSVEKAYRVQASSATASASVPSSKKLLYRGRTAVNQTAQEMDASPVARAADSTNHAQGTYRGRSMHIKAQPLKAQDRTASNRQPAKSTAPISVSGRTISQNRLATS